ncbi:MAG: monovalent cation/H(+) antiporter subunit G [Halolamina sp.]
MSAYPPLLSIRGVAVAVLLVVGTAFLIVGTLGLLRLPNVYNRMHATSKATTLGAASIALSTWVVFGPGGEGLKGLVTVVFLFVTAPTGSHMISRSAQRMGVPFVDGVSWPRRDDEHPKDPADGD